MSCRKNLSAEYASLARSSGAAGPRFWRSLEELSKTADFQRMIEREFPHQAAIWPDSLSRRKFLTLMAASLALGGVHGCSVKPAPSTQIVPYVRPPKDVIPGQPLFYATTMTLDGGGVGLLVETHSGRPTKVEGNPDHPASLGATGGMHQASILELYDPDRSQTVRHVGKTRTWDQAIAAIRGFMRQQQSRRGAGLRLLTETIVSPTLQAQVTALLDRYPEARWHCYEPLHRDSADAAARQALGEVVLPRYDFTQADVVVSLDDDFLTEGPAWLRYSADFTSRRRVRTTRDDASRATMNRLYVAETALSCTGAKADHRIAAQGKDIERLARALATELGLEGVGENTPGAFGNWAAAAAQDLASHRGNCLVLCGRRQPAAVHLLAHAMNDRLGNVGKTIEYIDPIDRQPMARVDSLRALVDDLQQGIVAAVIVLGGNPAYNAPADIPLTEALRKAKTSLHFGPYEDETSRLCQWHLPESHYLESWSDSRAYDGTASIVQPMIEPLTQGRSAHELLAILTESELLPGREIVRSHWRRAWNLGDRMDEFETRWETALHDGVIEGSRARARSISLAQDWRRYLPRALDAAALGKSLQDELEIVFLPDPSIHDGRFSNNGWLQELPKPITKITWGNVAIVSPATAKSLGLSFGEYAHGGEHGGYQMPVVELRVGDRAVEAPLWIMPGHADGTVAVGLGFGRRSAGRVGGTQQETVGFDAYRLRTSDAPWFSGGCRLTAVPRTAVVACTQQHHQMEERSPVRQGTLSRYQSDPGFAPAAEEKETRDRSARGQPPLTLYESYDYAAPKHKWGMVIDLTTCIGCNACVVACQAENNIPVVGQEQVARGREMHWIRIDRYIAGPPDRPEGFHFQPLPCMHCENAPCEYVCPVEATVHSAEGLNDMVYNRCVGTRFCSNNCPYKVRRFNFLAFADFESPERRMQYNPDVTVRSRGVMEKCSYCVQRLRQAEIGEQTSLRPLVDGDVLTACQAACPTQAIVFGDMNAPNSKVAQAKESPLHYAVLEKLNTVPRTTYLAELKNPNSAATGDQEHG